MATVAEHYASHLAPIYVWMAGGMEAALAAGAQELVSYLPGTGLAVDLGAGLGMHSIPLAKGGHRVIAVDTSAQLLRTLRDHSSGLEIETKESDLRSFRKVLTEPAELIVCMGDTLTHLQSVSDVEQLCADVAQSLKPTGRFVATFRDYSSPPTGALRFIPVRSDADRILTCCLEDATTHVVVHDILHEREGAQWSLKVSSYRKLRLAPTVVETALRTHGLAARVEPGPRGMVRVVACS